MSFGRGGQIGCTTDFGIRCSRAAFGPWIGWLHRARSKEQGARSKEQGARSKEQGARIQKKVETRLIASLLFFESLVEHFAPCSLLLAPCLNNKLFFFNELADIDQRVAHTTKG